MDDGDLKKFIGNKIKEQRKKRGLTQHELGERLGVKNNTISAYERGVVSPDSDVLFAIGNILDIRVDDLFPHSQQEQSYLDRLKGLDTGGLNVEDTQFLQQLIKKPFHSKGKKGEVLESIRFVVDYHDKMNRD